MAQAKEAVKGNVSPAKKICTRIIFSHGDKGGVGKSMVAAAIANHLRSQGEMVAIVDADTRNPDVQRMFVADLPCIQTNLRSENGWMEAMEFVVKHPGHTIVINTPAGIGEHLKDEISQFAAFLNGLETPSEMELWWTINLLPDSVNLLSDAFNSYGQHFTRVRVVRNLFASMNDTKAFIFWDECLLKKPLEKAGGMTINFPPLHLRIMAKLFSPSNIMPFSDANDVALGERVGFNESERFKLDLWIKAVGACLEPALSVRENAIKTQN